MLKKIEVILEAGAYMPERAHDVDAGLDLRSRESVCLKARSSHSFNTGVHVNIPQGYGGFLKAKSGLNVKFDIIGTGLIDAGYTGAIVVKLYNNGPNDYQIGSGDKIIQLVIAPIETPELVLVNRFSHVAKSVRGDGGFGSSGK